MAVTNTAGIKICGLRRIEDADAVNSCLPEYAGFVFAEGTRKVLPGTASKIRERLDIRICPVGVFVNEQPDMVADIAAVTGLGIIQLHGGEQPDYIESLKQCLSRRFSDSAPGIWKALRVSDAASLEKIGMYRVDAFVLDAFVAGQSGGTGKVFDWRLASGLSDRYRIVLAGGLNPKNVLQAGRLVRPYAFDVSSGVETEGWKDITKIRDFIYAVRSSEREAESNDQGKIR